MSHASSGIVEDEAIDFIANKGWVVGKALGEGAFGRVVLVSRESDKTEAACKIIEKPDDPDEVAAIEKEFQIMKQLDHPGIVKCYDTFESYAHDFLMLELCRGGELFDRIVQMTSFSETMAADITYQVLSALRYMHGKGIVHRDLKPENLLLADDTPESLVKVTDFGLSHVLDAESHLMTEPCGTLAYIAPEILQMDAGEVAHYDKQVDVWSMGTIVYILLSGRPPFPQKNEKKCMKLIKKGEYQFKSPQWDPISEEAKAFISRMLVVDPKERATIGSLLEDDWLEESRLAREHTAAVIQQGSEESEPNEPSASEAVDLGNADLS